MFWWMILVTLVLHYLWPQRHGPPIGRWVSFYHCRIISWCWRSHHWIWRSENNLRGRPHHRSGTYKSWTGHSNRWPSSNKFNCWPGSCNRRNSGVSIGNFVAGNILFVLVLENWILRGFFVIISIFPVSFQRFTRWPNTAERTATTVKWMSQFKKYS